MYCVMHLSDIHWESKETSGTNFDNKVGLRGIVTTKSEEFFTALDGYLSNNLNKKREKIRLFIISGDIIKGGDEDAHKKFFTSFIETISRHGYEKKDILITPGNHDVKRGSKESSAERYEKFYNTWKDCQLPYLDGVREEVDIVFDKKQKIMFIPVNTANWSQVNLITDDIKNAIKDLDDTLKQKIEKRFSFDPAYISKEQIASLRQAIESVENYEEYNKVLVQHHHFTQVGSKVEIKALENLLNIEELKDFILEYNIRLLMHGHKHENKDFYEYLTDEDGYPYQLFISSSANISDNNLFKILKIKHLRVTSGTYTKFLDKINEETYSAYPRIESLNSVIFEDNDITSLYAKINAYFKTEEMNKIQKQIICHLNLEKKYSEIYKPPIRTLFQYPEQQSSFSAAVKRYSDLWLQKDSLFKDEIPIHGIRLKQYGGYFDQIQYIIDIINSGKSKSRGIAVLLEPTKDFKPQKDLEIKTDYPSFITCQVIVREKEDKKYLDIVGNYRSQEMHYWWQLNIVELFQLLSKIKEGLNGDYGLGKITTITSLPSFANEAAFGRAHVSLIDYLVDIDEEIDLPYLAHSLMCNLKGKVNPSSDFIKKCDDIFDDLKFFTCIRINADGNSRLRNGVKQFTKHLKKASIAGNKKHMEFIEAMEKLIEAIDTFNRDDDGAGQSNQEYTKNMKMIKKTLEIVTEKYETIKRELCG